jgi:hypothetical protein
LASGHRLTIDEYLGDAETDSYFMMIYNAETSNNESGFSWIVLVPQIIALKPN